nr:MAG TPA: RimK-related lysine biosynthesis protein, Probable-dependent amine/thiol ligase family Amino-group [Caudoviricetes sp.]
MLKRSTIAQIVEGILAQTKSGIKLVHEDVREETFKRMANEATIILKTAIICENGGIDEAMEYYNGTHTTDEYEEFRLKDPTSDDISLCKDCNCMTHTLARKDGKGLTCGKCGAIK